MTPLIIIWVVIIFLVSSAVTALIWAIQTGQFSNLNAGARSIFDDEEPIGRMTDAFPGSSMEKVEPKAESEPASTQSSTEDAGSIRK